MGRLSKRREFLRVAKGRSVAKRGVVVQARASDEANGLARLGFTASRKVGKAVERNRAKRRLREAARQLAPLYARPGADYVFIARASTSARDWPGLLDDVKSALITLSQDQT